MRDVLGNRELRGPRQITSANIDRIFDDHGRRFLVIEEKGPDEKVGDGQALLLRNLAGLPAVDVWGVRGTPDDLRVTQVFSNGGTLHLASGDWSVYQRAVDDWFASDLDPSWEQALVALAEVPYDPPAWCPRETWTALDEALTAACVHRARHSNGGTT
jgi:hypothetical protein